MAALVTGATGFVGGNLLDDLLQSGEPVRAFVRDPAKAEMLRQRGIETVVGDISDPEAWDAAVAGMDVVYHCAAAPETRVIDRAAAAVNRAAVRCLLESLRKAGRGRALLITGLGVLGLRNADPITEDMPLRPMGNPGFDAKVAIELLARKYHRRHGVDVTVLRPAFIYGPGDRRNLPQLLKAIRAGEFAYIGSRHNIVPMVQVSDMVQALRLAARTPAARGRTYHISDGARTTISELAEYLAGKMGCPPPRRVVPYFLPLVGCTIVEAIRRRRAGRRPPPITRDALLFLGTSRFVDIRRARDELGYAPRVPYREGMAAALRDIDQPSHQTAGAVSHA